MNGSTSWDYKVKYPVCHSQTLLKAKEVKVPDQNIYMYIYTYSIDSLNGAAGMARKPDHATQSNMAASVPDRNRQSKQTNY